MKQYLLTLISLLFSVTSFAAAPHEHGRAYELNGGSGSGGMILFLIVFACVIIYVAITSGKNKK